MSRHRTSALLRNVELPDCFALATVASEAHILARPPSKRRLADRRDLKRLGDQSRRLEGRS